MERFCAEIDLAEQVFVKVIASAFEFVDRDHYIAVSTRSCSAETVNIVWAQNKYVADLQDLLSVVAKVFYLSFGNIKYLVKRMSMQELVVGKGQMGG